MTAPSLLERLRRHLAESGLFPEPGLAVLAVSGGGDSVAMLDLLAALAPDLGLSLLVAHADHGILPDSTAVAERVSGLAKTRFGLETVVGALDLGPKASETRARTARYRFLRQVQADRGARYLVTAHHADDQVETVLLRLLRGSAPAGLAGIAPRASRGLIRPLLPFSHAELTAHSASLGAPIAVDPTNRDPRHMRAWVRTALWPVIEQRLRGMGTEALLAVAGHASREVMAWDALLDALPGLEVRAADGRFEVARGVLSGYHNVLAGRILRAAARRAGIRLAPGAADRLARFAAAAASGRRLMLGENLMGEVAFDRLVVARFAAEPERQTLRGSNGEVGFGDYLVRWREAEAPAEIERGGWTTWVRAVPGGAPLTVRPPAPGERLAPLGGVGRAKVARLLMAAKVPRAERQRYPVVATDEAVLWIPGVCRGADLIPEPGREAMRIDVVAG
ncbi:MAG: tRNA lysidine(34) synthetase TilS [Gemmatimonadales bacterium]|nr:tRNA lysidine(34) synthetase TilS [Gemmatimonadales bacterium]